MKNVNQENKEIWNTNAGEWDKAMGEFGNDWHLQLIAPETERLLNLKEGQFLLDAGCGNGIFSRRMANKGVKVTAFDFSETNIELSKKYSSDNIDYHVLDMTFEADLIQLTDKKYHGIVSNMVFMDVPEVETFFSKINYLMKDDGHFVFSIQHPCFNSEFMEVTNEENILMKGYIDASTSKGKAVSEQKEDQFYFHRPISYYINLGAKNGLVVDACIEPTFEKEVGGPFTKFPPILIISMRKLTNN
ncbi:methyltransferase domain-containing protein [Flammeovirga yaeyamensis]|uniref:Methyltransferase domain-containing protein n=1 Tax=Flammeovirga yaeyamensis TaxID=367791 RepID=A0AAX1N3W6_9BACT|nr:methyltransferase domain-containing protein [Flammeovirga yaeyamensis]MBB3700606.1 2-polyprenyl-3-methyl-5-hydroxy-6-metoxy-1,4-benzoquinol methylase [Flammeovirga yaeyamensis]NMF37722.1 methyltransferase domain-containing protein [Flammeovirga yaeyamensis]QWG02031.1 methyltransferase domain-containing protein [Flammeovirga yaeyamensis]